LAARAGVGLGVGTVYRHFPSKEALFEAAVTAWLADVIADAHGRAGSPDPGAALFGFLEKIAGEAAAKRDLPGAITIGGSLQGRPRSSARRAAAPCPAGRDGGRGHHRGRSPRAA
jgi:AcrR family transcriptional regulator